MTSSYVPLRFDVTDQVQSQSIPLSIAAWVFVPPVPLASVALLCLPGGSYTKAYYHLEVPGYPPDAYSFALHLAQQGFLTVAIDHLGTGESTQPKDGNRLSAHIAAQANDAVTRQIRTQLAEGTLVDGVAPLRQIQLVGVGHSMGSSLLLVQQAEFHSFDAIAPLGWSNRELSSVDTTRQLAEKIGAQETHSAKTIEELLKRMYQFGENGYLSLDRSIVRTLFHTSDVPEQVLLADDAQQTQIPNGILADISNVPLIAEKATAIDVPLFLGNGQQDVSVNFRSEPETYPLANDITLFQLAGSAHCHNFASTRTHLWDRLANWLRSMAPINSAALK